MSVARVVAWRRTDESAGHSLARLEPTADGRVAHGAEVLVGEESVACAFRIDLDEDGVERYEGFAERI